MEFTAFLSYILLLIVVRLWRSKCDLYAKSKKELSTYRAMYNLNAFYPRTYKKYDMQEFKYECIFDKGDVLHIKNVSSMDGITFEDAARKIICEKMFREVIYIPGAVEIELEKRTTEQVGDFIYGKGKLYFYIQKN